MTGIGALLLVVGAALLILIASGSIGNREIIPNFLTPLRLAVVSAAAGSLFLGTGIYVRKKLIELHKRVAELEEERAKLIGMLKEEKRGAKEMIERVSEKIRDVSQRLRRK
jgi:hypothetical protein